jgi:hypothetical protein
MPRRFMRQRRNRPVDARQDPAPGTVGRQFPNAVSSMRASRTPVFCNCSFTARSFASRYLALIETPPTSKSHDDPCITQYPCRRLRKRGGTQVSAVLAFRYKALPKRYSAPGKRPTAKRSSAPRYHPLLSACNGLLGEPKRGLYLLAHTPYRSVTSICSNAVLRSLSERGGQ